MDKHLDRNRAFRRRWQTRRLVDHQEGARVAYVRHETAWADAWPHLDDWFKTEAFFIERGRCRPGIA